MPGMAAAEAKKEWKRLAPALEAMGVLTMADTAAFAQLLSGVCPLARG